MRRMPLVTALLAGWLLAATGTPLPAQGNPPSDEGLRAKLDEAVKQLAAYEFGGDSSPLGAMDELIAATHGKPALRKELAEKLAAVLAGGAPRGAKSALCRQLAEVGTTDQVAALAALLTDENVSHMARYALERISGPAAVPALEKALAGPPAALERTVVDAYLLCADALVAEGQREQAAAMYDRVRKGKAPGACRVAATRGAILARQAAGAPLLVEQLKGDDPALFGLALMLVRYASSAELAAAATATLDSLPPAKQLRLIEALAMVVPCLDDPALKNEAAAAAVSIGYRLAGSHPAEVAEAMKKALAASDNQAVRQRAQEVLGRTGKK